MADGKLPRNTAGLRKGGGRPKGVPNKVTGMARDIIQHAADGLGGGARLLAWAKSDPDNEKAFWVSIYPRLLPVQVSGEGGGPLQIIISSADADL